MRRRVPKLAIALGLGFPLLVAFTLVCLAADIRLNTTASLPLGLYIGTRGASDYISSLENSPSIGGISATRLTPRGVQGAEPRF